MVDADIEIQFSAIVAAVTDLLKPQGFKKRGQTLRRTSHGNVELIEFQRSGANGAHDLRFTLNIGIISSRLADENGADLSKSGSMYAHLNERIGHFLPEPYDKWWELGAKTTPNQPIREISAILAEKVLPYLGRHSADAALVQLWKSGQAPGLTDTQRLRYLSALEAYLRNEPAA